MRVPNCLIWYDKNMEENLITKNMQDVNADVDVSRVKLIILGIFSVLSAGVLGLASLAAAHTS